MYVYYKRAYTFVMHNYITVVKEKTACTTIKTQEPGLHYFNNIHNNFNLEWIHSKM